MYKTIMSDNPNRFAELLNELGNDGFAPVYFSVTTPYGKTNFMALMHKADTEGPGITTRQYLAMRSQASGLLKSLERTNQSREKMNKAFDTMLKTVEKAYQQKQQNETTANTVLKYLRLNGLVKDGAAEKAKAAIENALLECATMQNEKPQSTMEVETLKWLQKSL